MPLGYLDDEDTFSSNDGPSALPERNVLSIMVLTGPDAGLYYRVPPSGGTVGRGEASHFRIRDPYMSRRHAVIERNPEGGYRIRDLDSGYGMYVEGQARQVSGLQDGQRIQLSGETVIRVRFEDVNETELIHQMRMAAMSDPLTELANRRYLMQRLDQEISFSRRHKTPLALMLIDVDGFKSINDTYGHPVGDEVLKSVARLLERAKRREDVVARYAGDEFVIICRGESIDLVLRFAQRIVESVRNHPITVNDRRHTLSFSIGVAELEVDNPDAGPMELFVRADSALYHSKLAGRDRATAFQAGSSHAHPKRGDELDTLRVSIPPERPTDPSK